MKRKAHAAQGPNVVIDAGVLRQIRQHARSSTKAEVCGILIGNETDQQVEVEACIAGLNASQGGAHVTFTQDTWEHIYKIKDTEYPDHRMVGWYHSHPGFGVFLSDHDIFIHRNFFSSPLQIAWVYDPHSDEEGCFGWAGKRLERLSEISVNDRRGGENAGESGKAEPKVVASEDDEVADEPIDLSKGSEERPTVWLNWSVTVLSYLFTAVVGFAAAWYLFPQVLPVPYFVDARTGQLIGHLDVHTGRVVLDSEPPPNLEPGKLLPSPSLIPAQPAPATPSPQKDDKGKHGQQ